MIIEGAYTGMTWQQALMNAKGMPIAVCKSGMGENTLERLHSKFCRIDHPETADTYLQTYLLFYDDHLYQIRTNYRSRKILQTINHALGKPRNSTMDFKCWDRANVVYSVKLPSDPNQQINLDILDYNYAAPSVQAGYNTDPCVPGSRHHK